VAKIENLDNKARKNPSRKLFATPRLSMIHPERIPYTVTMAPQIPYSVPAATSEYPKSSERKSVKIMLKEKYE
jgi:hypothetical protein